MLVTRAPMLVALSLLALSSCAAEDGEPRDESDLAGDRDESDPPGASLGTYQLTFYWVANESDYAGADNTNVYVDFTSGFMDMDRKQVGPVPLRVVILLVAFVIGSILLNVTRFGRHVLAIGGNEEAVRLAGLPIGRTLLAVYAMSGALAGLAGVLLAWQTATGAPTEGLGWELSAIAAVVIGGTLLTGGMGSVGTTLVGAILLGLIFNVLNFENGKGVISLSSYWQTVIRGLILLVVVLVQNRLARRRLANAG